MRQPRTNALSHRYLLLLAAMLALSACGGGDEAVDRSTADIAAETAEADVAATTEADEADVADSAAAGEATVVPDWFPEDVYLPMEYSVVAGRDLGSVQQLELKVDGGVAELAAQARAGMQASGWAEKMNTGETTGYTKAQRIANVTVIARDDGGTRVTYQFSTL